MVANCAFSSSSSFSPFFLCIFYILYHFWLALFTLHPFPVRFLCLSLIFSAKRKNEMGMAVGSRLGCWIVHAQTHSSHINRLVAFMCLRFESFKSRYAKKSKIAFTCLSLLPFTTFIMSFFGEGGGGWRMLNCWMSDGMSRARIAWDLSPWCIGRRENLRAKNRRRKMPLLFVCKCQLYNLKSN